MKNGSGCGRSFVLGVALLGAPLLAQQAEEADWNAAVRARMDRGEDLLDLRYRRDAHGALEVGLPDPGADTFIPVMRSGFLPHDDKALEAGLAVLFLLGDGDAGLLGATDGERHLRRIGFDPTPVALRQLLLAPITSTNPELRRVAELDRIVAIDWLRRIGHRGVVAELIALAHDAHTPPMLAARAKAVLGSYGRGQPIVRSRLALANVSLPTNADVHVVVDPTHFPDLQPLHGIARRMALESSYRVPRSLRAPTPDDLFFGQYFVDAIGELPFEWVRRFGEVRIDHAIVSLALTAGVDGGWPFDHQIQAVGSWDVARVGAELAATAEQRSDRPKFEQKDGVVTFASRDETLVVTPTSLLARGKRMVGRSAELAAELIADGPAVRIVVPPMSKLWAASLAGALPAGGTRATFEVSFGEPRSKTFCRGVLTVATRDEDAAERWAKWLRGELASGATLRSQIDTPDTEDGVALLADVLKNAKVAVDGTNVRLEAACSADVLWGEAFVKAALAELRHRLRTARF